MKSKSKEKFTDFDELLNAYENLQSEFTRRCQRLKALEASLEKDKENDGYEVSEETRSESCDCGVAGEEEEKQAKIEGSVENENSSEEEKTEDTGEIAEEFGEEDAVGQVVYVQNERREVEESKESVTTDEDAEEKREIAVEQTPKGDSARVGYNDDLSQPTDIDEQIRQRLKNPKFVDEVIMTDNEITSRIIAAYLTSIAGTGSVATIKSGAGSMFFSPIRRPKSLAEARALAEKLLE